LWSTRPWLKRIAAQIDWEYFAEHAAAAEGELGFVPAAGIAKQEPESLQTARQPQAAVEDGRILGEELRPDVDCLPVHGHRLMRQVLAGQ
jgi:hypothetical protein